CALSGMTYCQQNKQLVWLIVFISITALYFNLFHADNWQILPFNPHPIPKEHVPAVSRSVLFLSMLFAFFHGFRFVSEIQKSEQKLQAMIEELQHKNENLNQVNEELDKFVYSAAHDLRAPLTSVLGLVSLMEMETKQPTLLNYFQLVKKTVNKLDLFIRDIVSYSHNARVEVECQEIDLNTLIKKTFEQFAFMENADKVRHSVSITGSPIIFSDQNRIEVILNNLISNAIKYADFNKAESFIEINLIITDEQVQISVIDNGLGIEEKHLHKIFNMFYRANERATGSGIGLYIAQETVKKLNGNLAVHSTLGIGTTMMLCFPNQTQVIEKVQEKKFVLETA
ncbi:MAG: sensor histidine kinase, partial [Bacteroidia bacterium]